MNANGPITHSYISQRLRLNYVEWGAPDAPPILLVHGGRDHARSWDWVARELSADWRVICPDLRGHGDSGWSSDGNYTAFAYVYDIAQLVHQLKLAPMPIVAHSLGGNISLRYTGLYPDNVTKICAIEGLGPSPKMRAERAKTGTDERMRKWIDEKRRAAGLSSKRYANLEDAYRRMKEANGFLTDEQARHLTVHGISQNEDGTYSWKFDDYMRVLPPLDIFHKDMEALWQAIACPTLLMYGEQSWASNPEQDGRIQFFKNARVLSFPNAGHWLHHDQFDMFMKELRAFLAG